MDTFIKSDIGMGFLGLGYHFGGSTETPGRYGCMHLMEHLMCKPFDDLRDKLKRLGIDYNAYTSDGRVVFYFSGLEDDLREVALELYQRITTATPSWSEESFLNERSTVLQEYADAFNDQNGGTYYNLLRKHYGYYGPIGLKKDIEGFTYNDSLRLAAGMFPVPFQIVEVGSEPYLPKRTAVCEPHPSAKLHFMTDHGVELEEVPKEGKTILGVISNQAHPAKDVTKISFAIDCLTDGLESPLYQEIREKRGLSYFSWGIVDKIGDYCVPLFLASTTNERKHELMEVYQEFFGGDVARHISPGRFEDCKQDTIRRKRKGTILPHQGAGPRALKDFDFTQGIEEFTYEECLEIVRKYLSIDSLYPVEY